jgi:hypothetical protein
VHPLPPAHGPFAPCWMLSTFDTRRLGCARRWANLENSRRQRVPRWFPMAACPTAGSRLHANGQREVQEPAKLLRETIALLACYCRLAIGHDEAPSRLFDDKAIGFIEPRIEPNRYLQRGPEHFCRSAIFPNHAGGYGEQVERQMDLQRQVEHSLAGVQRAALAIQERLAVCALGYRPIDTAGHKETGLQRALLKPLE